jgi:hypothetical protein
LARFPANEAGGVATFAITAMAALGQRAGTPLVIFGPKVFGFGFYHAY